jgi:phage portal protein BeeE
MAFRDRVRSALWAFAKERTPGAVIHNTAAESMPGVVVTDDPAMRFATVHACIQVLSEDIASLPIHVYQRDKEGGKERLRSHPLYELVHDRPNPEMTAFIFKE